MADSITINNLLDLKPRVLKFAKPVGKVSGVTDGEMKEMISNGFDPNEHKPKQENTVGEIDYWKDSKGDLFYRAERSKNYEPTFENISNYLR